MAKKETTNNPERTRMFIFGAVLLVLAVILFVYERQAMQQPDPTPTAKISPTLSPATSLLVDAAVWYPSAPWSAPSTTSQTTFYGDLKGEYIKATVTNDTVLLPHFEQVPALAAKGFLPDNNLAADGPGSSVWGYKKTDNGMTQIMTFSYRAQPTNTNANEPVQFNCPCKIAIDVFVSNPFSEK